MKKIKSLCLLLVMVLFLSGCAIKEELGVKISNDKSMEFNVVAAMDNELIDMMLSGDVSSDKTTTYTDEERWRFIEESLVNDEEQDFNELKDLGYSYQRYEDGEFKGLVFTKKVNSIDDFVTDKVDFNFDDLSNFGDTPMFVKNGDVYEANLDVSGFTSSALDYSGLNMDLKFTVELPEKAISNNASEVSEDGKVLTWNLLSLDGDNVNFSFKLGMDLLPIVMGVLGIALIVIIIIVIVNGNKKNITKNANNQINLNDQNSLDSVQENDAQNETLFDDKRQN